MYVIIVGSFVRVDFLFVIFFCELEWGKKDSKEIDCLNGMVY